MAITITKPTVGGSEDSWGTTINTALDTMVDALNGTAGTVAPDHTVLTLNGTDVTSTAAELNILDGVTATSAELNILDGDTAAISTTVVDADRVVFNDDGTMKQVAMSDLKTYINASVGSGSVTSVAMTVPTGLTVSGSPITTSGTLAVSLQSGYSIPTTSSQSNWKQGYLTSAPAPTSSQVGSAMAGLSTGAVGTFAFAMISASTASTSVSVPNGTTTSSLFYTDRSASNSASYKTSGTWKCMGYATNEDRGTVWMRIA
jgi:hypothetical protein